MTTLPRLSPLALGALVCCVSCGDYRSEHCSLWLPEEAVSLTVDERQHVSRFLVESHDGKFEIRLTFETEEGTRPTLALRPVDPNALEQFEGPALDGYEWSGRATVSCMDGFPCVAEFEAVVTAANASSEPVEGRLSVEVTSSECDWEPDRQFLAVEPSP